MIRVVCCWGKIARMLKSLASMIALKTVSWMLKSTHVELLPYPSLKAALTMTISMYYMIQKSIHIRIIDLKVNQFKRQQSKT